MKPFLEVEANRRNYNKFVNKKTVHRSSLLVPRFESAMTNISFLNHFLLKRSNKNIVLKITALDNKGFSIDSLSIEIMDPKVYSFNLEELFEDFHKIKEYIVEFYSDKNLFIPFPAVMVNHIGSDFVNSVHSYNRILNDIFEDDEINKNQVYESSIDVISNNEYDTFFNFATGPIAVNGEINITDSQENEKKLTIDIERLTNKNYLLSKIFDKGLIEGSTLKILQPKQPLFYGRLLAGIINKNTKSFSANHSYYDSSSTEEYFDNNQSYRSYPYFSKCQNEITMYPIMSPSEIDIHIELFSKNKVFKSDVKKIISPSKKPISFNINDLVNKSNFSNVTLFKVVANTSTQKIPTRVNHQLIYSPCESKSKLKNSINISLQNDSTFIPAKKTGFTWGQILCNENFETRLGICFNNSFGEAEDISVEFYSKDGLICSEDHILIPQNSLIFDNHFFKEICNSDEFIWFVVKSKRSDISAQCFHYHRASGNASGEHSF